MLGVILLTAVLGQAGSPPSHPSAEVTFNDASVVRVKVLQAEVEIQTKYGPLKVPVRELRRINFGVHLHAGLAAQLEKAIVDLGGEDFAQREAAGKSLRVAGHLGYPFLKAALTGDPERAKRAALLCRQIEQVHSKELAWRRDDELVTAEFPIIGRIVSPGLKVHSPHFGELLLRLPDLRRLQVRDQVDREITVPAGQDWIDTGLFLDPGGTFEIDANGQVDLWPEGPGQYVTGPKGYTTAGKGTQFMAGALIGKIGEKEVFMGERHEGREDGKFLLRIAPSPWGGQSSGGYRVRIRYGW